MKKVNSVNSFCAMKKKTYQQHSLVFFYGAVIGLYSSICIFFFLFIMDVHILLNRMGSLHEQCPVLA